MVTERDKTTEDVREHLEQLVESYIDEGVASVSLARLFDNPQCKKAECFDNDNNIFLLHNVLKHSPFLDKCNNNIT